MQVARLLDGDYGVPRHVASVYRDGLMTERIKRPAGFDGDALDTRLG
jgi:hypothetical protein